MRLEAERALVGHGGGGGHCRDRDGALVVAAEWQMNLLRLEIPDAKARADVEDNFRKTIGQLLGGAAVLIGTGFAYYQSQLAQQATHDQLKATYDQIEASKAQIISQQVRRALRTWAATSLSCGSAASTP
jgi:hypothetical protein